MHPVLIAASALTLALATHLPAQAQSKKQLVDKVIKLQQAQIEQLGSQMLQQTLQPMLQQVGAVLQSRVPEDKREATGKALGEELKSFTQEVEPQLRASAWKHASAVMGPKLEASFNEVELKQLIQVLESPVLKRYGQLTPELQTGLAQKVGAENRSLMESRIRALDAKMATLLGLKPPAPAASKP